MSRRSTSRPPEAPSSLPAPFKEIFNPDAVRWIADRLEPHLPGFDRRDFIDPVVRDLPALELKARVERIAEGLEQHLPADFPAAVEVLLRSLPPDPGPPAGEAFGDFRFMPFSRYVSRAGLEHYDASLAALQALTKRFSVEFDIRYFLERYPERCLEELKAWALHPDWRVRRLASEGSRPRLPWGLRLKRYVQDPTDVLDLLEILRNEPHSAVQRSVANHLNDISKDHPDRVIGLLERWGQQPGPGTGGMTRHALRGLIKQGDVRSLKLLGFQPEARLELSCFTLEPARVRLGERITMRLGVRNPEAGPVRAVIDYAIHHVKANGRLSPKVFKLTARTLQPHETLELTRTHALKPVTTRVYYPGRHVLEVLVNGKSLGRQEFLLELG